MTTIFNEVAEKAIADHKAAVGRVHLCTFVIGYVDDTDDQQELSLNPPVRVTVNDAKPEHGVLHDTGTHLDPYWDLTPCQPVDPRIAHLRSLYTYGPSYDVSTGKHCPPDVIVPAPTRWQLFAAWVKTFWS